MSFRQAAIAVGLLMAVFWCIVVPLLAMLGEDWIAAPFVAVGVVVAVLPFARMWLDE